MKNALRLLAALCLFVAAAVPSLTAQTERILFYDAQITVHQDRTVTVQETIEVESAGEDIKHGIYRDFPTEYKDRLGNKYTVLFDVVGVTRDGATESYHTSTLNNGVRVYFGRSDFMLPPGTHAYVFTYRTDRQLGFFADHDELYWNVTGNAWKFPIENASATVLLPPRVRDAVIELGGYTGYQNEKGHDYTSGRDAEGNPVFRASGLQPSQGLTIVVTWPKGLIPEPTQQEKMQWLITDNKAQLIGVGGLLVILFYFLSVFVMVGRDPKPGTIMPLYEPQDRLSPAGMRYLEQMGFDDKVFTSAILGLASKGYLTIRRDESSTYHLTRKPGYGSVAKNLSPDEQIVATRLFEDGAELKLKQENHSKLQSAQTALKQTLETDMEKKYFFTNSRYLWPGVVLIALTLIAMLFYLPGSATAIGLFMTVWLSFWSFGVTMLVMQVIHAWKSVVAEGLWGVPGAIFLTLFSIPFMAGECFGIFMMWTAVGGAGVAVILGGIGMVILFHYLLKAPTRAGRELLDRIEGFKLFLKEVEGPRYAAMASPAKTPELFERYLPYALALGVEHAWAQQFAGVLAAAATSGSSQGAGYTPSWYTGSGFATFSAADFTSSFSSSFSSAVSSASTSPGSSSGSGGGGSSGGGGGGGGGGGW